MIASDELREDWVYPPVLSGVYSLAGSASVWWPRRYRFLLYMA